MDKYISVGVFHPGTQHSWQTSRALNDLGYLEWYATSIFYNRDKWPYCIEQYLPSALRKRVNAEFRRFYHPEIPPELVRSGGANEWIFRAASRIGARRIAKKLNQRSNRAFANSVSELLRRTSIQAVWGYDSCSLEAFEEARKRGVTTILDKTIGDWRRYNDTMTSVYEEYGEFFPSKDFRIDQRVIERQDREYDLADVILTGSQFCRSTLLHNSVRPDLSAKIRVVPYCFDDTFFRIRTMRRDTDPTKPVRFIFVGQAGPRKGIRLVLKAFERIPRNAASLTILGHVQVPERTFRRYADRVDVVHNVARHEVATYMSNADCLIFPSYHEGAAITVYEALACGLGIIQSENTDVVVDSGAGCLLPALTEDAVYEAVMSLVDQRSRLQSYQDRALHRASCYTFESYRRRVKESLEGLL